MVVAALHLSRQYELGPLTVAPVTPVIGAVVAGCDLRVPPATPTAQAIAEALWRHKVLFFKAQPMTMSEFVAFGRVFGRLQRYGAAIGSQERPCEVHAFEYDESRRGREAFWHFDVAPGRWPARASILRSRVVPDVGGDTLFADLTAVYDSLPAPTRLRLDDAMAIYDPSLERRLARFRGRTEAEVLALSDEPLYQLPIVVRGPDRRPSLMVNPAFLAGITGFTDDETAAFVKDLRAYINRPEFQCRFRWDPDDVAFWDNRRCLHYATNNYWPARRVMERLTLLDDSGALGGARVTEEGV